MLSLQKCNNWMENRLRLRQYVGSQSGAYLERWEHGDSWYKSWTANPNLQQVQGGLCWSISCCFEGEEEGSCQASCWARGNPEQKATSLFDQEPSRPQASADSQTKEPWPPLLHKLPPSLPVLCYLHTVHLVILYIRDKQVLVCKEEPVKMVACICVYACVHACVSNCQLVN